jgi:hypothetical protein
MRQVLFALVVSAAAATAGCDVYTPEDNIVENLSGTVQVLGQSDHDYTFTQKGELEVTIKSISPTPPAGQLYLALGGKVNGVCNAFAGYVRAIVVNSTIQFGQVQKGSACITIFDANNAIRVPTNYSGTISYP